MSQSRRTLGSHRSAGRILAFSVFAFAFAPSASVAQVKGGGGGGTGGGSIYFLNGGSTNYMWSMNSDGSNVTQLQWYGFFTCPSRVMHNGHRWFLAFRPIPGAYYPDQTTVRNELFAYRDDYTEQNNNGDTKVQLTTDPTLQPVFGWFQALQWLPGDQIVSFKARRWAGSTVVEGGLYAAGLTFRPDGNITGIVAPPTAPILAFPLDGNGSPVFGTHSWDPTGSKVVYNDNPATGLWVADLSAATRTQIFSGQAAYPDWSPDGTKIAIGLGASIYTIKPNGVGLKEVIKPTYLETAYWSGFSHPHFSASGSYITCVGWTSYNGGTDDVFRATSSGGALTNLTKTPTINEVPVGWR